MGVGELIMVLMALGGFGVAQNTHAPSATEVTKYAPEQADVMVYADVESTVGANFARFTALPDDPAVAAIPELRKELKGLVAHLQEKRDEHKKMLGWDPVTDVKSAALWVSAPSLGSEMMPQFLVALRGKFPGDAIARGAKAAGGGTVEKMDGVPVWVSPPPSIAIALTPDGTALIGSVDLVKARVAPSWKPVAKKGSVSDRAAASLDERPFFLLASRPSAQMVTLLEQALGQDDVAFLRDFMTGHDYASVALRSNGAGWTYAARTPQGYKRAVLASDGLIQLLRAGHFMLRGLADVALAALESYAAKDPTIAKVVQHRDDILKIVGTWSGDGNFGAQVDKKDADRTVSVKLTGKTFSDVVPATALMLPGMMAFTLMRGGAAPMKVEQPAMAPVRAAPAPAHP
jgi:hypothetical protein